MGQKAAIYKTEGIIGNDELLIQLKDAVRELENKMKAFVSISKGRCEVGFGVSKVQRGIAADAVISVARVIKALKGW